MTPSDLAARLLDIVWIAGANEIVALRREAADILLAQEQRIKELEGKK